MAIEIKIPDLGDNIDSGTIVSVMVKVGDTIAADQSILELETDKAVLEVPSDKAGTVEEILCKEGDDIKVGHVVLKLTEGTTTRSAQEEKVEASAPVVEEKQQEPVKAEPAPAAVSSEIELKIPDLGDNIDSGSVVNVMVNVGDTIEKDQALLELETDKAVLEVPAEVGGNVVSIAIKAGDTVKIGQVVAVVKSTDAAAAPPPAAEKPAPVQSEKSVESKPVDTPKPVQKTPVQKVQPQPGKPIPAAPSVRKFAREIGINIVDVPGSGPSGRISIDDVKAYSKQLNENRGATTGDGSVIFAQPLPDFTKWGDIEKESMSKVREKTATHLSSAWATIPHVTQFDKADITEMEKLRKQFGKKAEAAGGKLTMTAILLKIVASALKVFPQFNASVDLANKEIIYKKYINVGIAVDTDRGLLVPVIRDVDKKNVIELSIELTEIAKKARDKKLTLDDMQGGNFTISNLGGIGGTAFTPIVNAPEVAILGVSRGSWEPVYNGSDFEPRLMLPLSLSYDHRIIDGADGARFARWICQAIEQPFTMLLEG